MLLSSSGSFADSYRVSLAELPLALAAERFFIFGAPILHYGAPFRHLPNLSLLVTVFALLAAFRAPTRRGTWAIAMLFLVGMLGHQGGVTTLLGILIPFADQIRGPIRMIVPAGFLLSWLAAYGMQGWLSRGGRARQVGALACCAWLALLAWTLRWPQEHWVEPETFRGPPQIANASPRLAVDLKNSRQIPHFGVNAGLVAEIPTLLLYEPVWPRNYFEAIFASQFGGLEDRGRLERLIAKLTLPLPRPSLPLLRAFRLRTLVRYADGTYQARELPGAIQRFRLVSQTLVARQPHERWRLAASSHWDPQQQAIVEEDILLSTSHVEQTPSTEHEKAADTHIRVLTDNADYQLLEVESPGGLLITSELFFPGWEVTVDDQPARALQVDLALRAVVLPPGTHRVEWRYSPTWLGTAIATTSVGGLILVSMPLALRSSRSRQWRNAQAIESKTGLPRRSVWPMTLKTMIREDRTHVATEGDRLRYGKQQHHSEHLHEPVSVPSSAMLAQPNRGRSRAWRRGPWSGCDAPVHSYLFDQ